MAVTFYHVACVLLSGDSGLCAQGSRPPPEFPLPAPTEKELAIIKATINALFILLHSNILKLKIRQLGAYLPIFFLVGKILPNSTQNKGTDNTGAADQQSEKQQNTRNSLRQSTVMRYHAHLADSFSPKGPALLMLTSICGRGTEIPLSSSWRLIASVRSK